jgi:hypothetical protein
MRSNSDAENITSGSNIGEEDDSSIEDIPKRSQDEAAISIGGLARFKRATEIEDELIVEYALADWSS